MILLLEKPQLNANVMQSIQVWKKVSISEYMNVIGLKLWVSLFAGINQNLLP